MKNLMRIQKEKNKYTKRKAFTLVEVIVAMFIFVLVISGSTIVFANTFKAYQSSKHMQESLENAQYALSLLSKTFRTSSVVDVAVDKSSVTVFNYSRNECVKYSFSGGTLQQETSGALGISACAGMTFTTNDVMTSGNVTGKFYASKSVKKGSPGAKVGMITVTMTIISGNSKINIQTSSSLRDYGVSDITL